MLSGHIHPQKYNFSSNDSLAIGAELIPSLCILLCLDLWYFLNNQTPATKLFSTNDVQTQATSSAITSLSSMPMDFKMVSDETAFEIILQN